MGLIGLTPEHTQGQVFPYAAQVDDVKLEKFEVKTDGQYGPSLIITCTRGGASLMDFRNIPTDKMKPWTGSSLKETMEGTARNLNQAVEEYLRAAGIFNAVFTEVENMDLDDPVEEVKYLVGVISNHLKDARPMRIKTLKHFSDGKIYARAAKFPPFAESMTKIPSELKYSEKELEMMERSGRQGAEEVTADVTDVEFESEY